MEKEKSWAEVIKDSLKINQRIKDGYYNMSEKQKIKYNCSNT